jgi:hypothetical protein
LQLGGAVVDVPVQEIFGLSDPVSDCVPGDVQSFCSADEAAFGVQISRESLTEVRGGPRLAREGAEFASDEILAISMSAASHDDEDHVISVAAPSPDADNCWPS